MRNSSSDVLPRQPSHGAGRRADDIKGRGFSQVKNRGIVRTIGGAMAVRTLLQLGNPTLRETCKEVKDASATEIRALVEDLADTLAFWRKSTGYGRGIAAPQIGVTKRVVFLRLPGEDPWPLVNPKIVERSAERIVVWDACLSFLSIFMQVERNRDITVRYQDLQGQTHEIQAGELRNLSELLQHETDHLDGILCIDRVTDLRTVCTKEEFEKRYRAVSPYATSATR
jgi:peptide deformylase